MLAQRIAMLEHVTCLDASGYDEQHEISAINDSIQLLLDVAGAKRPDAAEDFVSTTHKAAEPGGSVLYAHRRTEDRMRLCDAVAAMAACQAGIFADVKPANARGIHFDLLTELDCAPGDPSAPLEVEKL